jgi:hypothetical protein
MSTIYSGNAAAVSCGRHYGLGFIALLANTPSIRLLSQQRQAQRTRQLMLCNNLALQRDPVQAKRVRPFDGTWLDHTGRLAPLR